MKTLACRAASMLAFFSVVKYIVPLSEVVAYAKEHKGKTTMGSAGVGSISHLTLLLFNHLTGADVTHVPYRGLSEAINDLLGGQIDLLFDQVVTATPHILNDSENAIVVTIPQ